ncbi:MAG: HEAT repeat domain-containing protein [Acidobacteriota bacterium]|nr:HEAT repeat domain-containing protein [Acidobacteriota bacterium]
MLLIAASGFVTFSPAASFVFPLNPLVAEEVALQDKDFERGYREGRDLIDREEWAKAAAKFNEIISKYPDNKFNDAALYWLAFCYKKQKQFKEANAALDRLLKDFPDSSWADDARVMKLETGHPLGIVYSPSATTIAPAAPNGIYQSKMPSDTLKGTSVSPTYAQSLILNDVYSSIAPTKLDREDEIKLAAFQSLLSADPKRAIETAGEILRTGSKASESFKTEVIRAFRSPRMSKAQGMTFFSNGVGSQFTPLLRETLVKSFQNESSVKIRKEIIYAIASISGEQSASYLAQLYNSETDAEIKKAIINSLSNPLHQLLETNSNVSPSRKIAFDKLMDIIRNEKDAELRRTAFTNLQRFAGWAGSEQAVEMLSRLYDGETSEEFKISIIQSLSNLKHNQASRKLLEIARNEKSDKLKVEAIYALRTSKDPEVLKFLEELIK